MQLLVVFLIGRLHFAVYFLNYTSASVSQVSLCFLRSVFQWVSWCVTDSYVDSFIFPKVWLLGLFLGWAFSFIWRSKSFTKKKYLCTELVNLSPIRILFGHKICKNCFTSYCGSWSEKSKRTFLPMRRSKCDILSESRFLCVLSIFLRPPYLGQYGDSLRALESGIEPRWGWDFPCTSRSAPSPTQPPVQWVSVHYRG